MTRGMVGLSFSEEQLLAYCRHRAWRPRNASKLLEYDVFSTPEICHVFLDCVCVASKVSTLGGSIVSSSYNLTLCFENIVQPSLNTIFELHPIRLGLFMFSLDCAFKLSSRKVNFSWIPQSLTPTCMLRDGRHLHLST